MNSLVILSLDKDELIGSRLMWNYLRSFVLWLHEPNHVVRFQRYFGLFPIVEDQVDLNQKNDTSVRRPNGQTKRVNGQGQRKGSQKLMQDTNVLDECLEEIKHDAAQKENKNTNQSEIDYRITSWFWYYFFQFGSSLGNEIFYIVFFPTWIWNVDGLVARQVCILWAFFMYIGQASKDILGIPRPRSPPVLQLEKRYAEEYGFPSTHAMFAAGIPLAFALLSYQRYDFDLWIGLTCAALVCLWVCLSRIYLGMHSFLDIIGGACYTLILIYIMFPYVSAIDDFQLNFTFSPILNFILCIILIKCYPSVKQWSTARSDTTVILGATFGFLSAATIMNKLSLLDKPLTPPIYSIIPPNLGLCFVRTILGMLIVYATRQIVKTVVLRLTCRYYGLDWKDPESKRSAKVEMPYYYLTYSAVGFNVCFTCPLVYRMLGINRDYSYTEL